ncbi:MAG: tRNA 4-thiouridine(8) synthase ThiI [Methanoculleus sp.]|uniref:tRNA uracil 4-sulfurtransferase ThiI n=1 Tax=unclassified Methanoculleus TaxID=2619537 RepID=UPI0025CFD1BB|nr:MULTISPECIES: tRNA uracil 4-sulfurtransferase ThiI [unclassified Methanoculleus]MCK9317799.1 tRNA 4-thiouridine(8) synthase ThiI [Methanoculleus sp.]MDD2255088.1 tRNA 4-thiouridine(8) synthase ThiI [Methanoculleus sp.]MDD3217298.1 tRNA 4-thiouridine(8) synthase ThiI [Methanoculleus sp.]MDD4315384.1 tRNA 4-thiouridine(8) synthase ThiI [Methanoculleus sp.]MDD4472003.1 tRNA 4-thiouridine(8) synthase ThiI [Methanoculleus sp.]
MTEPDRVWLVRYSEVFLKSEPVRREWERALVRGIERALPGVKARRERGRIWLAGDVDPEVLRKIFGIVSFSLCDVVPLDDLPAGLLTFCEGHGIGDAATFALRIRRIGKHPFTSRDLAERLGDLIRSEYPHIRVDLDHPEREIFIEVRDGTCYLFDRKIPAAGGIPPGVEGTLVALVSGGIDSPVAAYLMMKRGCRIVPLYVGLEGYLNETNFARAKATVEALRRYQPDIELLVVRDGYLARARRMLEERGEERYTCLLCKRRMYRIAAEVARQVGAKGFVTGESMGQVASQTLDNLAVLTDAAAIPVYRPLIAFDKEDVVRLARDIGTFDASIAPAGGCGAVPARPSTAAAVETVRALEEAVRDAGDVGMLPIQVCE